MTTQEFLQVAPKLTASNLFRNMVKGEKGLYKLGSVCFGTTEAHYKTIWRKYGTLNNIVIFKTEEEVNAILLKFGISEFKAFATKSKTMCRLRTV